MDPTGEARPEIQTSFALDYAIFGLLVVVLLCGLFLLDIWRLVGFFLVTLVADFGIEFHLRTLIHDTLKSRPDEAPACVIRGNADRVISSIIIVGLLSWSVRVYMRPLSSISLNWSDNDLVATYSKSLLVSLNLFSLFLAAKWFPLLFRWVSVFEVQRGVFAMGHRVVVVARSLIVTPFWVSLFAESNSKTILSVIFDDVSDITIAKVYIVAKCVYLAQMLWDFDAIRRQYLISPGRLLGADVEAIDCPRGHRAGGRLRCGHLVCRECAARELPGCPFCPECGFPAMENPTFALFEGHVSLASMFCCF
jgi:hypothetical protein